MEREGMEQGHEARNLERGQIAQNDALSWKHISVRRFLVFFVAVLLLFVLAVGLMFFTRLNSLQEISFEMEEQYLPGILNMQRTRDNIGVLRREAAVVYLATDPKQRRIARLKVQALVAESLFENSARITRLSRITQDLIQKLNTLRGRSEEAASRLHKAELRLASAIAPLRAASGSMRGGFSLGHDFRHVNGASKDADSEKFNGALQELEPLLRFCRNSDLDQTLRAHCTTFAEEMNAIRDSWLEKGEADRMAWATWTKLDNVLGRLGNAVSREEFMHARNGVNAMSELANSLWFNFYIVSAMLIVVVLFIAIVMYRHILAPISLAARELRHIRSGFPARPLPRVRIAELQQLLETVPGLSRYFTELSARSDRLEEEKAKYETLSMVDQLTGVGNRRAFDVRLEKSQCRAPNAVLMIDVDFFKKYNDAMGHQAGDTCLAAVAWAIRASLFRHGDALFRYGGEEFAVILENVRPDQAMVVAERILDNVRALRLPHPSSTASLHVTVSIGVAVSVDCRDISFMPELVAQADRALYRAKTEGRNRICLYKAEKDADISPDRSQKKPV